MKKTVNCTVFQLRDLCPSDEYFWILDAKTGEILAMRDYSTIKRNTVLSLTYDGFWNNTHHFSYNG